MTPDQIGEYLEHQGASDEEIDEFLEHFGVKGMRWGVRRQRNSTSSTNSSSEKQKRNDKVKKGLKVAAVGLAVVGAAAAGVALKRNRYIKAKEAKNALAAKRGKEYVNWLFGEKRAIQQNRVDLLVKTGKITKDQGVRIKNNLLKQQVRNVAVNEQSYAAIFRQNAGTANLVAGKFKAK